MEKKKSEKSQSGASDEQILFPDVKIANYTITPWSFGILFDISALLDIVLTKVDEKGIADQLEAGIVPYTTIARLFTIASPEVLKIMAITAEAEEDKIKGLSMEDGIKMAYTIYKQNFTIIKNVFIPLLAENQSEEGDQSELKGELVKE